MISNFLKREHSDTNVTVVPNKRKKRPRCRSRKRRNNQCDNSGPKPKKVKTVKQQPDSSEVETIDEDIEKSVSEFIQFVLLFGVLINV